MGAGPGCFRAHRAGGTEGRQVACRRSHPVPWRTCSVRTEDSRNTRSRTPRRSSPIPPSRRRSPPPRHARDGRPGVLSMTSFAFRSALRSSSLGDREASAVSRSKIARQFGVKTIIATCSARNRDYVRELGATHTLDYTDGDVVKRVRQITGQLGVAVGLDTVGRRQ